MIMSFELHMKQLIKKKLLGLYLRNKVSFLSQIGKPLSLTAQMFAAIDD